LVAGRGFRRLKRAGIEVRTGMLEQECRALIEAFAKFITRGMPYVTLKLAATLDGRIAAQSGDARWISGEGSRALVHRLRNEVDAVIVGIGTVAADNPELTCRISAGRNPRRVVLDSRLRISPSAKLLRLADREKTIIATGPGPAPARVRALEARGARVWRLPLRAGRIAWRPLLKKLAGEGVVSVMIEGGAAIAASAIEEKIVDRILFFYAAKILGGDGLAMIGPLGARRISQAAAVKDLRFARSGDDLMVTGCL
jgi:diaminohydroxyphosphoribosylaminopyrimidine deaminase/5-amino-6-(5-phosphoribosylamino)uracil reductase